MLSVALFTKFERINCLCPLFLRFTKKKKVKNYKIAFEKFSGASERDYKYDWAGDSLAVLWNETTYLVSHLNDLKAQYKRYFEKKSYDDIYHKSSSFLWQEIINKELDWHIEDIIIDLYKEWRRFWEIQKTEAKGGLDRYEHHKRKSWEDLLILFELVKLNPSRLVNNAEQINERGLIPIIAMSLVKQFGSLDEFIDVMIKYITEVYYNALTPGHSFEAYNITESDENPKVNTFFVYEAGFEFDDIKQERF